jgi:hypothetical protein
MARDMVEAPADELAADELAYEQALVRSRWIAALRAQGHRKCEGELSNGMGGVCALGLLAEVAGFPERFVSYHDIADAAGLNGDHIDLLWRMNDGDQVHEPKYRKHSFSEIADVVEGWFAS